MFLLEVSTQVHAAHWLDEEKLYSKLCANIHGHTYGISVSLSSSRLDDQGMVVDAGIVKDEIKRNFDHKTLNDHDYFQRGIGGLSASLPTTAEVFARVIFEVLKLKLKVIAPDAVVESVSVRETDSTLATFIKVPSV